MIALSGEVITTVGITEKLLFDDPVINTLEKDHYSVAICSCHALKDTGSL